MMASTADVYVTEMPGGQYTNLYQQAHALGLGHKWPAICRMYADVNQLFGDIVKVTPSSKSVGDMALFLITNNLTVSDVLDTKREVSYPESVVDLLSGRMGQPPGGFPPEVQKRILRGQEPLTDRPGAGMPPVDFKATAAEVEKAIGRPPTRQEVLSYLMYPKVFTDFIAYTEKYADVSVLPTDVFLYGLDPQQEVNIEIERGKTLIVKFLTVGDPHPDGRRTVFFELNGQPRSINVRDTSLEPAEKSRVQADAADPLQVGSPMPGKVSTVAVRTGQPVKKGERLLSIEAMKMETAVYSPRDAKVGEIHVEAGAAVESKDLLVTLKD
jgi:pyruvate carboxylase